MYKLTDLAEDWLNDLRFARKSARTITIYRYAIKSYVATAGEDLPTRRSIRTWLASLEDHSPSTVRTYFIGMQALGKWLVTEKLLDEHPMTGLPRPQVPDLAVEPYTNEEVEALLAACKGCHRNRDRAIISLLSATGMRISECASIQLANLDMQNQTVAIIGKGSKPRLVPFDDETRLAMRSYVRSRFQKSYKGLVDHDYLWLSQRGILTARGIDEMLRTWGKQAGVEGVRAHRFRNSFATTWMAQGRWRCCEAALSRSCCHQPAFG